MIFFHLILTLFKNILLNIQTNQNTIYVNNISWKQRHTPFTTDKTGLLEDFLFRIHLLNTQQYNKSNGKSSCWYSAADVSNDGKS